MESGGFVSFRSGRFHLFLILCTLCAGCQQWAQFGETNQNGFFRPDRSAALIGAYVHPFQ